MSRFTVPLVGAPSAVAFPPVMRRVLGNGLRVWTVQHSAVPVVSIVALANAGTSADPDQRPGLASLTAALMTEGAGRYDAIELADALARLGGQLELEASTDVATLTLSVLAKHFEAGLDLVRDIVQRPRLAASDFERVRDLRLSRLKQLSQTPGAAADRTLLSAVFGDHPYGHGGLGTTRAVEAASLDDVHGFWERRWRPSSMTLLVAGDLDVSHAATGVERAFEAWTTSNDPVAAIAPPVPRAARSVLVVHRPGAPQSEIRVGQLGPPRLTPQYHALVALNAIVGGQFTSRINRNLREARGITYGARSSFDMRRAGGLFACDSSVQADSTSVALAEVLRELREVGVAGAVSTPELDQARASLTRGYVRHFETTSHLARAMTQLATYALDDDTFDRFVPEIERLTPADITAAAATCLHADDCALIVAGDLDQVGKDLESLGRGVAETRPEF